MEPIWRHGEVALDEEFDLTESFTLSTPADAFVFSDFLGVPTYLARIQNIGGRYDTIKRLSGRYEDSKRLEGDT